MQTKNKVIAAAAAGTVALAAAIAVPLSGMTTTSHRHNAFVAGADNNSQIIGGTAAVSPNIVQLILTQQGKHYGCTGELISSEWIVTAKHCTHGDQSMDVYFSNSTTNRGPATAAVKVDDAPFGDIGLVHLSKPHVESQYVPLADASAPHKGQLGIIAGYGLGADDKMPSQLHASTVMVDGYSMDAFGGLATHIKGVDGASNHGDSGGPLVIDGKVAGICSTGDSADPGSDIHAGSSYANITVNRLWIKHVTGV